jgi:dynein heavy chain
MDHFVTNVQEALDSLVGGLDLAPPSAECVEALGSAQFQRTLNQNKELLGQYEALLEGWCDQIQNFLDQSDEPISSKGGEEDVGPRAELEYWRNKMQRLTSIAEQLKRKDCRQVITALSMLTKNSTDGKQQKIVGLLRRWKEKDVQITEKANEAKDNVKYLFTLERFIEPLYTGSATTIIDTLPALMNSIKMIHHCAVLLDERAHDCPLLAHHRPNDRELQEQHHRRRG